MEGGGDGGGGDGGRYQDEQKKRVLGSLPFFSFLFLIRYSKMTRIVMQLFFIGNQELKEVKLRRLTGVTQYRPPSIFSNNINNGASCDLTQRLCQPQILNYSDKGVERQRQSA